MKMFMQIKIVNVLKSLLTVVKRSKILVKIYLDQRNADKNVIQI